MEKVKDRLFRLKTLGDDFMASELNRCLSTADITLLGIGHMIGAGVYVLTGAVVRNTAGPGIVLSFLFAGVASFLSALCYAEFGARVPKAGSAYTYSYVTVGEFWAFIIGWNVILEHMLGAAAVARSWSGYLDSLTGHAVKNATVKVLGSFEGEWYMADYPDLGAMIAVIVVGCFMAHGAKASTRFTMVFTAINLSVIVFVILLGMRYADFGRWTPFNQPGTGFMPYGFSGVMAGAASCFFAYIGFDGLSTAAEEAKTPSKSIPIAIFISMCIVTGSYILMSSALTLMVDYDKVQPSSAFSDAFEQVGESWAKYVVAIGAIAGMTTSLCGSMFALPRCVYAMANDGLIFKQLAVINPETQVPTLAVAVFGGMTALLAATVNIETLVQFLSIGTLMAYTIVSGSVIILRYRPGGHAAFAALTAGDNSQPQTPAEGDKAGLIDGAEEELVGQPKACVLSIAWLQPLLSRFEAGSLVSWSVGVMTAAFLGVGIATRAGEFIGTFLSCVLGLACAAVGVGCFALINCHHQSRQPLVFKVPYVPLLPSASILINVLLMMYLNSYTWLRLVGWLAIGFVIYFLYGVRHSKENQTGSVAGGKTPASNYSALGETSHVHVSSNVEPSVSLDRPQPAAK